MGDFFGFHIRGECSLGRIVSTTCESKNLNSNHLNINNIGILREIRCAAAFVETMRPSEYSPRMQNI